MNKDEDNKVKTNVKLLSRTTWFVLGTILNIILFIIYITVSYNNINPNSIFEYMIYGLSLLGMFTFMIGIDIMILLIFDRDERCYR